MSGGMKRFYWLAVLAVSVCNNAWAMGPFEFYEQALRNDPVYLGAIKERDAGLEKSRHWPRRAVAAPGLQLQQRSQPIQGHVPQRSRRQSA
nr:hypothetical protein GCM10020185_76920 [Pseudomonas brassicacearum subsp. brassicacearum]